MRHLSLLLLLGLSCSGCATSRYAAKPAPKGETCEIRRDPTIIEPHYYLRCFDGVSGSLYDKKIETAGGERYIARPADYDEKVLDWCLTGWRRE